MTATLHLTLSNSQRMALVDILVYFAVLPDQPQEFIDVVENRTTTVGELIRLLMEGYTVDSPEESARAS